MSLDVSITGDTGQPGRCEQCGSQGRVLYTPLGRRLCEPCRSAFAAGVVAAGTTGGTGAAADVTEAVVTDGLLRRLVGRFRRTPS